MQDCVGALRALLQHPHRFARRENQQLHLATLSFVLHFIHHRQAAMRSGADDKPHAVPGDVLFNGQRRVPETVAELLGRLFLALADFATINNDDVVLVSRAVDLERTERETAEFYFDLRGANA